MSLDSFVHDAYQRLHFRAPSPEELELASAFVASYEADAEIPEPPNQFASMPSGGSAIHLSAKKPASIHVAPIKAHSIIAVKGDDDPVDGNDGVGDMLGILHVVCDDDSRCTFRTDQIQALWPYDPSFGA